MPFSERNLFVSKFRISTVALIKISALCFDVFVLPFILGKLEQNPSSWTKSIQIDNLIEMQIDR